jgi:nucleotide-binding universal stress UspA family protein
MSERVIQEKAYEIVVGFDFSELSERAVEEALNLASRHRKAELHVVTVADVSGSMINLPGEPSPLPDEEAQDRVRLRIARLVEGYNAKHGRTVVERFGVYVLTGVPTAEPGKLITRLAESVDADVIVVGTHGRKGIARLILGSVAQQVVREATTSVYVVRPTDMVNGQKVPAIEPPLASGAPHLRPFEHRRTYHYVDRVSHWTDRVMPVS